MIIMTIVLITNNDNIKNTDNNDNNNNSNNNNQLYKRIYSSIYNNKLNEVFEKTYDLPFFSNINKDHFLIKFYNIESIPDSLKPDNLEPQSITQNSEIDLNNFDISNFNKIFFNNENGDDRFNYLNDIILYLYGKKYYLYIIFIIVKTFLMLRVCKL